MANREILKRPRVQHVAANIRLNPFGQTVDLKCSLLGDVLVSFRDVESPESQEFRGDGLK